MPTETRQKLCLDSNVFLAVILPEVTKAPRDDIRGAERLIRALQKGEIAAVTSVMALAEIRWVFEREHKPGFDIARTTLEDGFAGPLTIFSVDAELAVSSATYRWRYYSKSNPFSYNDGIFLATAVRGGAGALVTTDSHLLHVSEIPTHRPSAFPTELRPSRAWRGQRGFRNSGEDPPASPGPQERAARQEEPHHPVDDRSLDDQFGENADERHHHDRRWGTPHRPLDRMVKGDRQNGDDNEPSADPEKARQEPRGQPEHRQEEFSLRRHTRGLLPFGLPIEVLAIIEKKLLRHPPLSPLPPRGRGVGEGAAEGEGTVGERL